MERKVQTMGQINGVLFAILALILLSIPCHAEVLLKEDRLTIDVQGATVHEVLNTLTQKAQINIITLEETNINNVRISKRFWNLPLEKGIHRVLSGWNYGITRDVSTGKITTLYLASQRTTSATSGSPTTASTTNPSNQIISQSQSQSAILNQTYSANILEPIDEEDLEGEEDFFDDEELETLPSNLIEILERWEQNGKG